MESTFFRAYNHLSEVLKFSVKSRNNCNSHEFDSLLLAEARRRTGARLACALKPSALDSLRVNARDSAPRKRRSEGPSATASGPERALILALDTLTFGRVNDMRKREIVTWGVHLGRLLSFLNHRGLHNGPDSRARPLCSRFFSILRKFPCRDRAEKNEVHPR